MGTGFATLVYATYSAGFTIPGLVLALLSPLSLYSIKQNWRWAPSAALAIVTVISAYLVARGFSPLLSLIAILCCLAAWDLSDFQTRLPFASTEDSPLALEQSHLLRLIPTLVAGFLFSWAALTFELTLNFDRVILLIIFGVAGLGLLVSFLRQVD
jgi:hypothetical protein